MMIYWNTLHDHLVASSFFTIAKKSGSIYLVLMAALVQWCQQYSHRREGIQRADYVSECKSTF